MNLALDILLIVLVAAFAWVGVEAALTMRKARTKIDGLVDSVNATLETMNTTIAGLDKTVADLGPAVQEVQPLLGKVETTVDALSLDLLHVNDILGDVSSMTGAASKATDSVTGVVERAGNAAQRAVSKLAGKAESSAARLEKAADEAAEKAEAVEKELEGTPVETVTSDSGYFTYPDKGAQENQEN